MCVTLKLLRRPLCPSVCETSEVEFYRFPTVSVLGGLDATQDIHEISTTFE